MAGTHDPFIVPPLPFRGLLHSHLSFWNPPHVCNFSAAMYDLGNVIRQIVLETTPTPRRSTSPVADDPSS
jgi:hypothetical protein